MIKAVLQVRHYLLTLLFLCIAATSCEDRVSFVPDNEDVISYAINNRDATIRLEQIMYNTTHDEENPSERFKLVHISDPHISAWSVNNNTKTPYNLIQAVRFANQKNLRTNAMVATGDFVSNHTHQEAIKAMTSFAQYYYGNNDIPSFICTGNHDPNIYSDDRTKFIQPHIRNNILMSSNNSAGLRSVDNQGYSYADIPNPMGGYIRIISLDMLDHYSGEEYDMLFYAVYSQQQIDWLANIALQEGITGDHHIVILNHFPIQPVSGKPGYYLSAGGFVNGWYMLPEIIEAFRSRTTLKKKYRDIFYEDRHIEADYDFSNSEGEFVCYLGGHAHCFAVFDIKGFGNENPAFQKQRMILANNMSPDEANTYYIDVERKFNSVSSNSFNIYAIDTRERKIYITFYGAFKPRHNDNFPDIIEIDYNLFPPQE